MKLSLATGIILVGCAHLAYAGELYKCKGKNGELVITNMQCPDAKSTQHLGSYQAVRDDPGLNNKPPSLSRSLIARASSHHKMIRLKMSLLKLLAIETICPNTIAGRMITTRDPQP